MVHRYSFIPVFSMLLSGLAWWSHLESPILPGQVASCGVSASCVESRSESDWVRRKKLMESLEHLVASQLKYRDAHGGFTKYLDRTGFVLPQNVARSYDLKVAQASENRLLIQAFSKEEDQYSPANSLIKGVANDLANEKVLDWISIDQDYKMSANFELASVNRRPASVTNLKGLEIEQIDEVPKKEPNKVLNKSHLK